MWMCTGLWSGGLDPWVGKIPWSRKWQPTPVFLPGKSHGQRSLVGYSPRDGKRVGHDSVAKQWNSIGCSVFLWCPAHTIPCFCTYCPLEGAISQQVTTWGLCSLRFLKGVLGGGGRGWLDQGISLRALWKPGSEGQGLQLLPHTDYSTCPGWS